MTSMRIWRIEFFIISPEFAIPLRYFSMAMGVVGVSTIKSGMASVKEALRHYPVFSVSKDMEHHIDSNNEEVHSHRYQHK